MNDKSTGSHPADIHVEMWKHYDNLRQEKNGNFLTANTILAAIAGLSFLQGSGVVLAIPLLGILIQIPWFLLLTRNGHYIAFHRDRARRDWKPKSWTPPSGSLDRSLPVVFILFWTAVLGVNF